MKTLYRYDIEYTSEDGETRVVLMKLPVFRETEYTFFIGHQYQNSEAFGAKLRQVRKDAMNTYAFDTEEKAMEHFIRRTNKRIRWFEFWTEECKRALEIAETMKVDSHPNQIAI